MHRKYMYLCGTTMYDIFNLHAHHLPMKVSRMDDAFLSSCKAALSNLLSSNKIRESDDPFTLFSLAIMNFYSHYCLDDHSSEWCHHDKVCKCSK